MPCISAVAISGWDELSLDHNAIDEAFFIPYPTIIYYKRHKCTADHPGHSGHV